MADLFLSEPNLVQVYRVVVNKLSQSGKTVDDAVFFQTFCGIAKSLYPQLRNISRAQQNGHLVQYVLSRALNTNAPRNQPEFNERHDREDNSDIETRLQEAKKIREVNTQSDTQSDENPGDFTSFDSNWQPSSHVLPELRREDPNTQSHIFVRSKRMVLCEVGANRINASNVVSIQLTSAMIPNTEYTISKRNNRLYFKESTTEEAWKVVEIDEGDYNSVKDVLTNLVSAMNMKGKCRYRYVIENQTGRVSLFCSSRGTDVDSKEQLPRLPGGENAQYITDTFQVCFGSPELYEEQTHHLGKILGFKSPQKYNGIACSSNTDERCIQSTHAVMLHSPEAVIVKFQEIPEISLLVPLHSQKGKGYFYCPKYAHRVQLGHYKNLPTHEHFLPNIGILTLTLTTTKNEPFDVRGATPAIEIEIVSIDNNITRHR